MFNTRAVRESVVAKLSALRIVDEATIHDLYSRAITEELKVAHQATLNMQSLMLNCVKVRQAERKWVMVDIGEWDALGKSITNLADIFGLNRNLASFSR